MNASYEYLQRLSVAGRQAAQLRNWEQVRACAREILNQQRNSAEGRFLLGLAEKGINRTKQATESFSRALEVDDSRYDAAVELANQYLGYHEFGMAAELLDRVAPLMVNSPHYLDMAGSIYVKIGLPSRALPLYRKADKLQPGVDKIRANLAACCVYVGEIDDARRIYRELLDKHPDHQANHYELSRLGRAKDRSHVDEMLAVLERTNLSPAKNIYLYYALGKELEDLEEWDESFKYLELAGKAVTSISEYDVQADVKIIDKIIEVCDSDWLVSGSAAPEVAAPIFVVGLPRTGTTLTERILSSHSQVESVGESFFLQIVLKQVSGIQSGDAMSPAIVQAAATKDMQRIADGYLQAIKYRRGDKPMFVEKLPENVLYLGFIARAFPQARIVLLDRNPMDTCFALFKQSYFRYAYSLSDLGHYYVAYDRLRRHWRNVLSERLVELDYEKLVGDLESQTRRILNELGLEFEPSCLAFEKNLLASNTASTVQIREKAHTRSVLRWKHFQKQLQFLEDYLRDSDVDLTSSYATSVD